MTELSFDVEIPGVLLERIIGRGASSTVYLGTQVRFGRKVAVKVLDRAVSGVDQLAPNALPLGKAVASGCLMPCWSSFSQT